MALHALDALDLATAVAGLWLALPPVVVKEGVPTELFVADRTRKYLGVGRGVRQLLVGKEGALAAIAVEQILLVNRPSEHRTCRCEIQQGVQVGTVPQNQSDGVVGQAVDRYCVCSYAIFFQ